MDPLMDIVRAEVPVALLNSGDLSIGQWVEDAAENDYDDWIAVQSLDPSIIVLPTIGNHDTYHPISYSSGADAVNPPHELIKSRYPSLFKGKGWYTWDYESLRIVVMLNCVDDSSGNYNNCNPPYDGQMPNPDYSGFDTEDSEQHAFIDEAFTSDHLWKIGSLHRPLYAPYPVSGVGRPTMTSQRNGVIRRAVLNGMSVLAQGDEHIRFVGAKYIQNGISEAKAGITVVDSQAGVGCWPIVNSGTYATNRNVDLTELPGTPTLGVDYRYASGFSESGLGCASLTMLDFFGNMAGVRMYECTDGVNAVLVHSSNIWRNPA
jgi:hypothetical protein